MAATKLGDFSDPLLDRQIRELVDAVNNLTVAEPGAGVTLRTPDGTKQYLVSIDNAGVVTTALIT